MKSTIQNILFFLAFCILLSSLFYAYINQAPSSPYIDSLRYEEINYSDLTVDLFKNYYVKNGIPLMIKGAAYEMPAMEKWTDSYLLEVAGDSNASVEEYPRGRSDLYSFSRLQPTYRQFLTHIKNESRETDWYFRGGRMPEPLEADVPIPRVLKKGYSLLDTFWHGVSVTFSGLHYDPSDNYICVFRGKKQFNVAKPGQGEKVYQAVKYPDEIRTGSISMEFPNITAFPNSVGLEYGNFTIEAGNCFFNPAYWWHEVIGPEDETIGVGWFFDPLQKKKQSTAPQENQQTTEK